MFQVHVKGLRGADLDSGSVDQGAAMNALKSIDYDGWLMMETSPGDNSIESARRNLAMMRSVVGSSPEPGALSL